MSIAPMTIRQREKLAKGLKRIDYRKNSAQRGYGHRWRKYRKLFLAANPLCRLCQQRGEVVAGSVVDHIIPHKGCVTLFWDQDNHQTLCVQCHNRKSATE